MSRREELRKSWLENLIRTAARRLLEFEQELERNPTHDEAEAFVSSVIQAYDRLLKDLPKE